MKSIKTIPYQGTRQNKISALPTISSQQNLKNNRQKIQAPCAFHSTEIITNFCKCTSCYLPLCPKCVKIHIEEHMQLGTAAKFQTIDDCLDEAHESILSTFAQAANLQKTSLEIEQNYLSKKECTLKQFEKAKLQALQYLSTVFKSYQQALHLQIMKEDRRFAESLIEYHDLMSTMMQNCRNSTKKFNSKSTIMEGLIGFYSKGDSSLLLKQCEQKLRKLTILKLEIITKPEQLQILQPMVQKYMFIGDSQTSFQKLLNQQKFYKEIESEPVSSRPSLNSIHSISKFNKSTNRSQNQSGIVCTNFLKITTLLDNFSLERSRNTRISIGKNYNQ